VLAIDFRRGRAHSTVRSIALHIVCGVSIQCLEWIVLPFIHSRHNTKDRSLGVGRDISWCFICYRNNRWQKRGICIAPVKHVVGFGVRQSNKVSIFTGCIIACWVVGKWVIGIRLTSCTANVFFPFCVEREWFGNYEWWSSYLKLDCRFIHVLDSYNKYYRFSVHAGSPHLVLSATSSERSPARLGLHVQRRVETIIIYST